MGAGRISGMSNIYEFWSTVNTVIRVNTGRVNRELNFTTQVKTGI